MNNIPVIVDKLNREIKRFLTTEQCEVSKEELEMYKALHIASERISVFLNTQQMENRKFEVGGKYYDNDYNIRIVEKVTARSVFISSKWGKATRYEKWRGIRDNERTRDILA